MFAHSAIAAPVAAIPADIANVRWPVGPAFEDDENRRGTDERRELRAARAPPPVMRCITRIAIILRACVTRRS